MTTENRIMSGWDHLCLKRRSAREKGAVTRNNKNNSNITIIVIIIIIITELQLDKKTLV